MKICKECQTVFEDVDMAKKRAICKTCFKKEYQHRYLDVKDKLKEKRMKKYNDLVEENNRLKEELDKTKALLSTSTSIMSKSC